MSFLQFQKKLRGLVSNYMDKTVKKPIQEPIQESTQEPTQ